MMTDHMERDMANVAMALAKKKRMTNEQRLVYIMRMYGPLAQAFILDAVKKSADRVSQEDPAKFDNPLISGQAWVQAAKEIKRELDEHFAK